MKQMLCGCFRKLCELDQVEITHRLSCDTSVKNKRTNTNQCMGKNLCFHFSLLKGLIVVGVGLAAGAAWLLSSKTRTKKKLMRRVEEKYFLVPVHQYRKMQKEKES